MTSEALQPDLEQAQRFLSLLDPDAESWTFQVFDDSPAKRGHMAKVCHGPLEDEARRLTAWSAAGAGVFTVVNATNGLGRKAEDITRVRALFVDLDGADLRPVLACRLEPHVITETSAGRYHAYWLVDGLRLDQFAPLQKALAARFGGDSTVHDLPRVMRLPGFPHQKNGAFLSRILQVNERLPYTAAEVLAEFPPATAGSSAPVGNGHDADATDELIRLILTGESYHRPLAMLAWRYAADGHAAGQDRAAVAGAHAIEPGAA